MDHLPSAEESRTAASHYFGSQRLTQVVKGTERLKEELNYITAEIKKVSAKGKRKLEISKRNGFHENLYSILEEKGYKLEDYDSDNHCSVTTYLTITW